MNPYDPPNTGEERTQQPHEQKNLVTLVVILACLLVVGGMVTFAMVRAERARVMRVEMIRAKLAAELEALRAREAASKQETPSTPSSQ